MNRSKLSRSEKRGLGLTRGAASLLLLVGMWRSSLEADPHLQVPMPRLPSPNAFDFYVRAGSMHQALLKATPSAAAVDAFTDPRGARGLSAAARAALSHSGQRRLD